MVEQEICISCKKNIAGVDMSAVFKCPQCGKAKIVRCGDCRKNSVKYVCPSCGFEGPN